MASRFEAIAATSTTLTVEEVVHRLQPQLAISFRPCSERQATDENSASSGAGSIFGRGMNRIYRCVAPSNYGP